LIVILAEEQGTTGGNFVHPLMNALAIIIFFDVFFKDKKNDNDNLQALYLHIKANVFRTLALFLGFFFENVFHYKLFPIIPLILVCIFIFWKAYLLIINNSSMLLMLKNHPDAEKYKKLKDDLTKHHKDF